MYVRQHMENLNVFITIEKETPTLGHINKQHINKKTSFCQVLFCFFHILLNLSWLSL